MDLEILEGEAGLIFKDANFSWNYTHWEEPIKLIIEHRLIIPSAKIPIAELQQEGHEGAVCSPKNN